jgi:hypothetical protein
MMKRTAERAVYVASLAEVPGRLAEITRTSDPDVSRRLQDLAGKGQALSDYMIVSVHGEATGIPPTAKEVGDWEGVALPFMRDIKVRDPAWFDQWPGLVRNRTTGKGGR